MWNKLSMNDRARYIQMAVQNGITDIGVIRDTYNQYKGGSPVQTGREDIEQGIRNEYKDLYDKYPARVYQDDNFMNVPGAGDWGTIETFMQDKIRYPGINYTYRNPYPGQDTIVFNNKTPDPQTAANLDYLHVLRKRSPEYQEVLEPLMKIARNPKGDFMLQAEDIYNRQLEESGDAEPIEYLLNNVVDGYLRNMFHPGSREDLERDNYDPDIYRMFEESPWLYEPTRDIYNFLHPKELDEVVVTPNKKAGGGKINRFDGGGPKYNRVSEVPRNPTDQGYSVRTPEGKALSFNSSKAAQAYIDANYPGYQVQPRGASAQYATQREAAAKKAATEPQHVTPLDEVVVVGSGGNKPQTLFTGSYPEYVNWNYDNSELGNITDQNLRHRADVWATDARVRESAAFEKPMNFLSPGQWFDAGVKAFRGEFDNAGEFFKHIYDGNSGWVSDEFAQEHPEWAALINFGGDVVIPAVPGLTRWGAGKVRTSTPYRNYALSRAMNKSIAETPRVDVNAGAYLTDQFARLSSEYNPMKPMTTPESDWYVPRDSYNVGEEVSWREFLGSKQSEDLVRSFTKDISSRLRGSISDEGRLMTREQKNISDQSVLDTQLKIGEPVDNKSNVVANAYADRIEIPQNKLMETIRYLRDNLAIHEGEHVQRAAIENSDIGTNRFIENVYENMDPVTQKVMDAYYNGSSRAYSSKEGALLNDAYTFSDSFLKELSDDGIEINEMKEKGATNREIRYQIMKDSNGLIGNELDTYIDNIPDEKILEYVKNSNGYGRDFYNGFKDKDIKVKAKQIREALKYVAMAEMAGNEDVYTA